jgi:hypothetical protein
MRKFVFIVIGLMVVMSCIGITWGITTRHWLEAMTNSLNLITSVMLFWAWRNILGQTK